MPQADPLVQTAARIYIAQALSPVITIVLVVLFAFWFFGRS
jgi:hypothetical protein